MYPDIDAYAAVVKKSASDMRALYGDTLTVDYEYDGAPYTSSATYYGTVSSYSYQNIDPDAIIPSNNSLANYDIIVYQLSVPTSGSMILDVTVDGLYSRFDGYARGGFIGSVAGLGYSGFPVSDARNSVTDWPNNYAGNFRAVTANDSNNASLSDYYGFFSCFLSPNYSSYVSFRMIQFEFEDGGTIEDVHFDGLRPDGTGHIFIGVICPYVDGDIATSPEETTITTTVTDINVNVDVDVDLTETNGILSGIKQGIDNIVTGIINGLKALFIPSDDFMDDFKSDMEDLAEDHLGGLYEAESILVDMFEQLPEVASKNEIYIEPVNLPLAGETLTLGDWHVPLKVAGIPSLFYDGLAFIIDFLCLMAFLRMCRNKLEIFLNPDTEVITE